MFTLILLTLLLTFLKCLHFIYLFQIKEYRFDRFFSFANEVGLSSVLYSPYIRYPAKTLRNFMMLFFVICTLIFLLLIAIEISSMYYFLSFILPFSPVLSLVIVVIGVILTMFPAYLQRQLIILRAKNKVKNSKAIFIGITGTFGKTSVKEFIFQLLSTEFKTGKTDDNQNTDVGVALSILRNLKKDTSYFVAEFGAYKLGEIEQASYYIPLHFAVLTGLGNQHIDLYGNKDNLITEETSLLFKVPKDGKVYIKYHVPKKTEMSKHIKAEKVWYGFEPKADIRAIPLSTDPHLQSAQIFYKQHEFTIFTRLLGKHNIENLLPAIALSLDLGISKKTIIKAIEALPQIEGKLSIHTGKRKSVIINDAVNSNVEGFISAIQTLQTFSQKKKIIVTQGIIELGVEKRNSYERIIEELEKTDIRLFTTDSLFKELLDEDRIQAFNDVSDIKKNLLSQLDKHTIILLEGKFPKTFIESVHM